MNSVLDIFVHHRVYNIVVTAMGSGEKDNESCWPVAAMIIKLFQMNCCRRCFAKAVNDDIPFSKESLSQLNSELLCSNCQILNEKDKREEEIDWPISLDSLYSIHTMLTNYYNFDLDLFIEEYRNKTKTCTPPSGVDAPIRLFSE